MIAVFNQNTVDFHKGIFTLRRTSARDPEACLLY